MTTILWESTLFGGWAIMRTPIPIASGALRLLAIASVSNYRLNITASCWLPDDLVESMSEHKMIDAESHGEHIVDVRRHTLFQRFAYRKSALSMNAGDISICVVKAVRGYTDWTISNTSEWTSTWDIAWHHLVMQGLKRFPSEDLPLQSETDPWLSTLQNFSFRARVREMTWNLPIVIPALEQMNPYFAVWLMLRRRLIAAHQQPENREHCFSHEAEKFLYLLGLEKLLLTVQGSPIVRPSLKGQAPQKSREPKSGRHKVSSEIAQQSLLWEPES